LEGWTAVNLNPTTDPAAGTRLMAWIHINLKRITLTALFLFSVAIDLLIDLALT